jgi:bifunctional non-homologous end joining protein LigD
LKPGNLRPMLPVEEPLTNDSGFVHEVKWDGFRALAYLDGSYVFLQSRGGTDLSRRFPQVAACLAAKAWQGVLDGEIVALSHRGVVDFSLLRSGSSASSVRFVVFDVLSWEREILCPWPWSKRRALLEDLALSEGVILLSPLLPGSLAENLTRAQEQHWEGVVSKHAESPYLPGVRSRWWRKHKIRRSLDGVVVGFRWRSRHVRSLGLGLYLSDGGLCYVGSVGSGLGQREREFLEDAAGLLSLEVPPVVNPPADAGSWVWFKPHLVAEVEYLELTPQMRLRHPAFLRFRFDKVAAECRLEGDGR